MKTLHAVSWTIAAAVSFGACSSAKKATWEDAPLPQATAPSSDPAVVAQTQELTAAADEAWKSRGDPAKLQEAITKLEEVAKIANTADIQARLARAYYFTAESQYSFDPAKKDLMLATYEKGRIAGEIGIVLASPEFGAKVKGGAKWEDAATVLGPEAVPAVYWYATNLGKWASAQGFAERLANKDRIFGMMSRVLQIDPNYFYAAPHRYFGAYYSILPGFAGKDLAKSEAHFKESLTRAPNYFGTKVLMAKELMVQKQDRAGYDKLVKEVLEGDANADPEIIPEQLLEKKKAEELKAKADDNF